MKDIYNCRIHMLLDKWTAVVRCTYFYWQPGRDKAYTIAARWAKEEEVGVSTLTYQA
jgi:hypothetical protein